MYRRELSENLLGRNHPHPLPHSHSSHRKPSSHHRIAEHHVGLVSVVRSSHAGRNEAEGWELSELLEGREEADSTEKKDASSGVSFFLAFPRGDGVSENALELTEYSRRPEGV